MAEIKHVTPLDAVFYQPPYNQTRRSRLIVIGSCLQDYHEFTELDEATRTGIITRIEKACYNYTIEKAKTEDIMPSWEVDLFTDLYCSICYKVSSNLDRGFVGNDMLVIGIINGSITIEEIPGMTSQELFPQMYAEITQRIELSKSVKSNVKTCAMYKCKKCKENKCIVENRYNRSLDEGVNLTIICMNCGYSWHG